MSIFIRNDLDYRLTPNLTRLDDDIECLFIEIQSCNSKLNTYIGCIYRPPDKNVTRFTECLEDMLSSIRRSSHKCILAGDFNIDLVKASHHLPTSNFVDMMYSYSYLPYITKPTRLESSTLIDHIWINDMISNTAGIVLSEISDHCPIFIFSKLTLNPTQAVHTQSRVFSERNIARFSQALAEINWADVTNQHSAQESFAAFHQNYSRAFNTSFAFKQPSSTYRDQKPWLTQGLKNSIRTKNKLYVRSIKNPTIANKASYKVFRNKVNSLLRKCERDHYTRLISENKRNLRKTWSIIRELLNKPINSKLPSEFNVDGRIIADRSLLANEFNRHYVNVATNIHNRVPPSDLNPVRNIERNDHTMHLRETDETEIRNVIQSLRDSSPGWDDLSGRTLKSSLEPILPALTCVLNRCLQEGVFPAELKVSKVVPVFKSGQKTIINNYRPISLLPYFSKILEKLIHKRMMSFIEKYDLLYKHQYGFRPNHNTCSALSQVVHHITEANERGEYTVGLFLDLSKAFDCLDYGILFQKLYAYGFRGRSLDILKSYLSDRHQFVEIERHMSSRRPSLCGVPQGSILGPLLFLLYMNDIHKSSDTLSFVLYADDTNILLSGSNPDNIISMMNSELPNVTDWLNANKLCLNVSKTHFVVFRPGRSSLTTNQVLYLNQSPVNQEFRTKFLGVIMDSRLKWVDHISYIRKKLSKNVGILNKLRKVLNTPSLLQLYYSFIHPYISYCLEIWGSAAMTHIDSICKIQKLCCRLITNSPRLTPSLPLFEELNIMSVNVLYKYSIGVLMYKFRMGRLPQPTSALFAFIHVTTSGARRTDALRLPLYHFSSSQQTISYSGPKIWNWVIQNCVYICSLYVFKKKLKQLLLL